MNKNEEKEEIRECLDLWIIRGFVSQLVCGFALWLYANAANQTLAYQILGITGLLMMGVMPGLTARNAFLRRQTDVNGQGWDYYQCLAEKSTIFFIGGSVASIGLALRQSLVLGAILTLTVAAVIVLIISAVKANNRLRQKRSLPSE